MKESLYVGECSRETFLLSDIDIEINNPRTSQWNWNSPSGLRFLRTFFSSTTLATIDLEMKRRWQWDVSFLRAQREKETVLRTRLIFKRRQIVPSQTLRVNVKTKLREWRLVCERECRNVRCVINWNSFRR